MKSKIKLKNEELKRLLGAQTLDFPKYSTQILNLANQNAQGTRPNVVGQMSNLIQEFSGKSLAEWEKWYLEKHPEAIKKATEKIADMINNFKDVMNKIDYDLVEKWVYDLVIVKTFIGLKFQEAILKKISDLIGKDYRLSNPEEESRGIDGYVGNIPISIKPESYKTKPNLKENIEATIIFYQKAKDGISIDISPILKLIQQ